MEVVVRAAEREDADGITDVHVASWRGGYAHVLPDSVLYADDFDEVRRSSWRRWRFSPGLRVAVATTEGDRIVGFASFGPERERARGFTGRGEVWAFYVDPEAWGTGVADALMEHAETRLRTEAFDTAVLWVLKDNPRARRFYERHGWSATGIGGTIDIRDITLPEVEYRKGFA